MTLIDFEMHLVRYNAGQETVFQKRIEGCSAGAVMRALSSNKCGPGSIPRSSVICGLSLSVLYYAPRCFLRVLWVPSPQKLAFHFICVN